MSQPRFAALLLVTPLVFLIAWSYAESGKHQKPDALRADKDYASELPHIPPKSPVDSLKTFRLRPGFRIELAAAEPLLASPVPLDFDEDGRLYVVEYPEYNQYASQQPHGRGRVRLLEDPDGHG